MYCISLVTLLLTLLPLTLADFSNEKPTPTLPFTLQAFQSPYPAGYTGSGSYGVSGVKVRAFNGFFYVDAAHQAPKTGCGDLSRRDCAALSANETVLWVDEFGRGWLNSSPPQKVYLNARTGALSYGLPGGNLAPGANVVNFLHLGEGTSLTSPLPPGNPPDLVNVGSSTFNWNGVASNDYWGLCPAAGLGYQVFKFVRGKLDPDSCLSGIALVALDWTGKNPAVGSYL